MPASRFDPAIKFFDLRMALFQGFKIAAVNNAPAADNPLLRAKNCWITPHFAWASTAARARLLHEAAENIRAFQRGERRNVVNAW